MAIETTKTIAKRSDWLERQKPGMKSMLREKQNYGGPEFEDYRPSLKKLIFGKNYERYAELFKSPHTPDPYQQI